MTSLESMALAGYQKARIAAGLEWKNDTLSW